MWTMKNLSISVNSVALCEFFFFHPSYLGAPYAA